MAPPQRDGPGEALGVNAVGKALKLYIHKGDTLIEVSFITPIEEFAEQEPALRAALKSIEFE